MTVEAKELADEILTHLAHCNGSSQFHKFSVISPLMLTEGVKYLCEKAGAYWLMDIIANYQPQCSQDPMLKDMQLWKLVRKGNGAVVTCERDTDDVAITQEIEFTDFPLDEIKLYCMNDVILLPSEY